MEEQNKEGTQGQAHSQDEDPWTEWEPGTQVAHNATTPPQPDQVRAATDQAQHGGTQRPSPTSQPATIRKGIYLSALIYVEGDFPPAADFIAPATAAIKKVFSTTLSGDHSGLTMTLKSVDVQNNIADAESKSKLKGESKFQF